MQEQDMLDIERFDGESMYPQDDESRYPQDGYRISPEGEVLVIVLGGAR